MNTGTSTNPGPYAAYSPPLALTTPQTSGPALQRPSLLAHDTSDHVGRHRLVSDAASDTERQSTPFRGWQRHESDTAATLADQLAQRHAATARARNFAKVLRTRRTCV